MDMVVSAIVGDLMSRMASFVIGKWFQHHQQQPGVERILERLRRVVLRIDTVVEEAEGRRVTNQGMLRQLDVLRQGMYRGHYMIDALRLRALGDDDEEVSSSSPSSSSLSSSSSALSRFSTAKRLRFSGNGDSRVSVDREETLLLGAISDIRPELQRMVHNLEDAMADMKEFLFFLDSYPPVTRQPHGAYLLLDNCMFGRQTERRRVLDFLLCPPSSGQDLAVLPIVGLARVGKSTLVEHVCRDESVRGRFSMILFFSEDSLKDEEAMNLRGNNISGHVKHQNPASQKRLLIIAEMSEDVDEGTWSRMRSSAACMITQCGGGSKIIITSRSDRIANLGTTEALQLDHLPPDAYWHFFKSIAFGSANPDEQPKLAAMAMEIASEQRQCFVSARTIAEFLHDNFNAQFWGMVLRRVREYKQKNLRLFAEHPNLLLLRDEPVHYWGLSRSRSRYFMVHGHHQLESADQVPSISVKDIVLGACGVPPCGEFEALAWRSRIPPYYSYTCRIIMPARQHKEGRKKRAPQDQHLN